MTGLLLSIDYLDRADISVYFDSLLAPIGAWGWVGTSDKAISFSPAVAAGVEVIVRRSTSTSAARHVFSEGAQFTSSTLDENTRQALYAAQEMQEGSGVTDIYNDLNMHGKRVANVGTATTAGDAIPYGQLVADFVQAGMLAADFRSRYMGPFSEDPATNGELPLLVGALYYNTTSAAMRYYNGEAWEGWLDDHEAALNPHPQYVAQTAVTGAAEVSTGTTAQRPATGKKGHFRFNEDLQSFEGFNGTDWGSVGGGARGGVGNPVFYENDSVITKNYTVTAGKNAMSAGPITINDAVTVTIPDGSVWAVI